ncbi:MAG: hypothetical protein N4A64_13125 [Marinisporobacter sp.]|jgi:amino acid permease|nr:hypothetical protein [Marinisporobacter sp.]
MILKLILLIMLCIPIACLQLYLLVDTVKDLKNPKKSKKRTKQSMYSKENTRGNYLKIAK